jgi:hypothetical protein
MRAADARLGCRERRGQRLRRPFTNRRDNHPIRRRAAVRRRDWNFETLIGAHLATQTDDGDVKRQGCEPLGGTEFVRHRKRVEHRGQAGIKNAVEDKYINLHGYIDIKDVFLIKRQRKATPAESPCDPDEGLGDGKVAAVSWASCGCPGGRGPGSRPGRMCMAGGHPLSE